jgi:hypothetical protein
MKISSLSIKMTRGPPTLNFKITLFLRVNFEFANSCSRLKDTNKEVELSLHTPRRRMEEQRCSSTPFPSSALYKGEGLASGYDGFNPEGRAPGNDGEPYR